MPNIYNDEQRLKGLEKTLFSKDSKLRKEDKEDLSRFYRQLTAEGHSCSVAQL